MKNITFGTITKTQGLKGEFRVKANPEFLPYVANLKIVNILSENYHVKKVVDRGGFFVFSLQEFDNINQIEKFINLPISAEIKDYEEKVNYVGYTVIANNKTIGEVIEINNYGSADVATLKNGKMFAIAPNLIESVNDSEKLLIVNNNVLNEVMV